MYEQRIYERKHGVKIVERWTATALTKEKFVFLCGNEMVASEIRAFRGVPVP